MGTKFLYAWGLKIFRSLNKFIDINLMCICLQILLVDSLTCIVLNFNSCRAVFWLWQLLEYKFKTALLALPSLWWACFLFRHTHWSESCQGKLVLFIHLIILLHKLMHYSIRFWERLEIILLMYLYLKMYPGRLYLKTLIFLRQQARPSKRKIRIKATFSEGTNPRLRTVVSIFFLPKILSPLESTICSKTVVTLVAWQLTVHIWMTRETKYGYN